MGKKEIPWENEKSHAKTNFANELYCEKNMHNFRKNNVLLQIRLL